MEDAQATIEAAHIQAVATLIAAKIAGSLPGNPNLHIDIEDEFERTWVAVGHGIRRGKKALAEVRKAAKSAEGATK